MSSFALVGASAIGFGLNKETNLVYRAFADLVKSTGQNRANIDNELQVKFFLPQGWNEEYRVTTNTPKSFEIFDVDCPRIPIPKIGAKFFGKQLAEIQAVDYLPYPTAYNSNWMEQKLKDWWGAARTAQTPFMLYAHTPDLFGHQIYRFRRREQFRRNIRIPLIGAHFTGYLQYINHQLTSVLRAVLDDPKSANDFLFSRHGFLRVFFPLIEDKPELEVHLRQLAIGLRGIVENLFVHRRNSSLRAKKWGDICMWVAGVFSKDVRFRIEGLKSISNCTQSLIEVANQVLKLDLRKLPSVDLNYELLLDEVVRQSVMHFAQTYFKQCYSNYDRVVTFEGEQGVKELVEIGVETDRIIAFQSGSRIVEDLMEQYGKVIDQNKEISIPKPRIALTDLKLEPPPPEWTGGGVLAMSDVHLGDGSGSSRAMALLKLAPKLQELGISRIDIVGDLCERTAGPYRFNKHKKMFNDALQQMSRRSDENAGQKVFFAEMELVAEKNAQNKSVDSIVKELQRAAIRCSLSLDFDGRTIGYDPAMARPIDEVNLDRGNHDDGEDLEKIVPAGKESPSLIRYDKRCGVVYVHGHIVGIPEYFEALETAASLEELQFSLSEKQLKKSLETAAVAYGVSTTLWRAFQPIVNFRSLYKEYLQSWLSGLGQWLNNGKKSQAEQKKSSEFARFVAGILSPIDNAEDAAKLAAAIHSEENVCWAVCEGHSHQWSIEKLRIQHPKTGQWTSKFRINCGKFHGKRTTCVIIHFPNIAALEWDEKSDSWFVLEHVRLTSDEIKEVLEIPEPVETTNSCAIKNGADLPCPLSTKTLPQDPAGTVIEVPLEGGGHIARFWAMKELYEAIGPLHVLGSGNGDAQFADENLTGYGIAHDPQGNVARFKTIIDHFVRQPQVKKEAEQLADKLGRFKYAITDFGPTLVEAMKIARKKNIKDLPQLWHISHQAALQESQPNIPRPGKEELLNYLSAQSLLNSISGDINLGVHYEAYNDNILTPLLSSEILASKATFDEDFILVYLRGECTQVISFLRSIDRQAELNWRVYTNSSFESDLPCPNIHLRKVGSDYRQDLLCASGILMNTGFMGTSEALHLGIPFATVPIKSQYEQACNAVALREIDEVCVIESLEDIEDCKRTFEYFKSHQSSVQKRLNRAGVFGTRVGPFSDVRGEVIERVFGKKVLV